jgi:hypothetical protein
MRRSNLIECAEADRLNVLREWVRFSPMAAWVRFSPRLGTYYHIHTAVDYLRVLTFSRSMLSRKACAAARLPNLRKACAAARLPNCTHRTLSSIRIRILQLYL